MSNSCIVILLTVLALSCTRSDNYQYKTSPRAGVCISFDDRTIDQWFELRELCKQYQTRLTFFVTRWDSLTPSQLEKLKILRSEGHEIGFHGALHVVSEYYIQKHSMNDYLKNEIVSGINAMNEDGFYPTSFSYPYSAAYSGTDDELLKYFYVLRNETVLTTDSDITNADVFFKHDGNRLVRAVAFDRNSGLSREQLKAGIEHAAHNNYVLMLYAHEPNRTFDLETLRLVFEMARENNLKYFRVSDLIK